MLLAGVVKQCKTRVVVWQVAVRVRWVRGSIIGWLEEGNQLTREVQGWVEKRWRKKNYEKRNSNECRQRPGTRHGDRSRKSYKSGNFVFVRRDTQIPRLSRKSGRIVSRRKWAKKHGSGEKRKQKVCVKYGEKRMRAKKRQQTPTSSIYRSCILLFEKTQVGSYFNGRLLWRRQN